LAKMKSKNGLAHTADGYARKQTPAKNSSYELD